MQLMSPPSQDQTWEQLIVLAFPVSTLVGHLRFRAFGEYVLIECVMNSTNLLDAWTS
jgi:hypothetical protein